MKLQWPDSSRGVRWRSTERNVWGILPKARRAWEGSVKQGACAASGGREPSHVSLR